MPYLALLDDTRVIPPQVDDGVTVSCPVCEQPMAVVKSHERGKYFISRYFRHHEQEQRIGAVTGVGIFQWRRTVEEKHGVVD